MPVFIESEQGDRFRSVPLHLPFVEQLFFLGRPYNAVLPSILACVGYYFATDSIGVLPASLYTLLMSTFLIHLGFTILNDIADRKIDRDNHVKTLVTLGTDRQVKQLTIGAIGLVVAALLLALTLPVTTIVYVAAIIVFSYCYNHRPLQLSRRPIASIVALGLLYGGLPLLAGYSLVSDHLTISALLISVLWMIGRMSLSLLKDFKDRVGDARHSKQTFLLKYGSQWTLRLSVAGGIVTYAGITVLVMATLDSTLWRAVAAITFLAAGYFVVKERLVLLESDRDTDQTFDRLILLQLFIDGLFLSWLIFF